MDTGEGWFIIEEDLLELEKKAQQYPNRRAIFHVGEEFMIKGSRFKVKEITPFGIKLKLLKPKD
jgi:hypothetical protein